MTDEWRLEPLVARVVAWHNRHPLAQRITPQQVQSLGFVALPFVATTTAFSENFIPALAPPRVARWAARHAREATAAPAGGPLKQVAVDDAHVPAGTGVVMRYAMTAAVQSAGQRTRLLIGPDSNAPLLGRRLWSPPRLAVAGAGVTAAVCLLVTGIAVLGEVPEPAGTEPTALAAAILPEAAAPKLDSPPDAEPRLGRIDLPLLVPAIDGAVRDAARQARAGVRPAPATAAVVAAPRPPKAYWAVKTRLLRTRAESQQWLQALDELLHEPGSDKLQVELLPEGADWRVVGWPYTRRADAERARALLLARGLKVEVVDF